MKNKICVILGNNIKKIRKANGLKQDELAESIGLEVKSLSLIETGNGFASAKTLEKLVSVLNIPLSELFVNPDEKETEFLYKQIIENLPLIRNNTEKLNTMFLVLKSLI